ncbi:transcription termination factor NusA [Paludibaculum fermentans]|uniref:Transcription termination/antitermination protein NusA n=1 Tax=Paludibaculum fermentans TaxID=1473598 RepID=A0A7S7NLQ8_PALFE|nr:transcription termination factor NusA [Paludibaculum fermentans]QOY85962.1 transcription termination/antitermination protein NusA [Paludibaculum fermentans]
MASIYQSIEILSKEKGIDPQIVLDAVKDAMLVAARKQFKSTDDLVADLDEKTGNIIIYSVKIVADPVTDATKEVSLAEARRYDKAAEVGAVIRFAKPTELLGRISAQTAKQVILQKVREAERENIFAEYSGRVGELVNCTIKRVEGPDLVVDLGKTEARLGKKEQSRLENFSVGERVRAVIRSVDKTGKNAGVIVSRAAPELVMRLFEQEVPEIYDGTVVIRGCAREAGERTKIAVLSRDRDVDCVGACVGMKGMRVQSIIRELRGEKIDIIEFSDDPVVFATHALSPAKISRVAIIDSVEKHMEVIVEDSQLSLAIGKKGQNVRLAAKLLGWRIDIKTEEEKRQEVEAHMAALSAGTPLSVLLDHQLPEPVLELLLVGGIGTVEKLGSMTPEELELIAGIDASVVETIGASVNAFYNHLDAPAGEPQAEEQVEAVAEPAVENQPESELANAPAVVEQPVADESDTMGNSGLPVEQ